MNRASFGLPPAPNLFGCERQERREQTQHRVQRLAKCDGRRGLSGRGCFGLTVGALFDQFEVVVGEVPEELFGEFERLGVVVVFECAGCIANHIGERKQHGLIDCFGNFGVT